MCVNLFIKTKFGANKICHQKFKEFVLFFLFVLLQIVQCDSNAFQTVAIDFVFHKHQLSLHSLLQFVWFYGFVDKKKKRNKRRHTWSLNAYYVNQLVIEIDRKSERDSKKREGRQKLKLLMHFNQYVDAIFLNATAIVRSRRCWLPCACLMCFMWTTSMQINQMNAKCLQY